MGLFASLFPSILLAFSQDTCVWSWVVTCDFFFFFCIFSLQPLQILKCLLNFVHELFKRLFLFLVSLTGQLNCHLFEGIIHCFIIY